MHRFVKYTNIKLSSDASYQQYEFSVKSIFFLSFIFCTYNYKCNFREFNYLFFSLSFFLFFFVHPFSIGFLSFFVNSLNIFLSFVCTTQWKLQNFTKNYYFGKNSVKVTFHQIDLTKKNLHGSEFLVFPHCAQCTVVNR